MYFLVKFLSVIASITFFLLTSAKADECVPKIAVANGDYPNISNYINVEITTLELAKQHGPKNVLVVFDIDNTLLAQNSLLGSDQWFGWQDCLQSENPTSKYNLAPIGLDRGERFDILLQAQRLLFTMGAMRTTSSDIPELLEILRTQKIPAIALTSRGPKTRPITRRELKRNGIELWEGFDFRDEMMPAQTGHYYPVDCRAPQNLGFTYLDLKEAKVCNDDFETRKVSFDDGLYLTAGLNKGVALKALLNRLNQKFAAIVFIDDHVKHLNKMGNSFSKTLGSDNVKLFHFVGEDARVDQFNGDTKVREKARQDWLKIADISCLTQGTWCRDANKPSAPSTGKHTQVSADPVTIMSFNVENLFDASNDPNNDGDDTYLPLTEKGTPEHNAVCERISNENFRRQCKELDWSEDVVTRKLSNIASVVKAHNRGVGPSIIILQEVETRSILERLNTKYLAGLGYQVIETHDTVGGRGIDVAVMSKLPLRSGQASEPHPVDLSSILNGECGNTRDILEVPLELPGGTSLTIFGVHFPSPRNPKPCRDAVMEKLNELQNQLPSDEISIAGGDFNITCRDEEQLTITQIAELKWLVPDEPKAGCAVPGSTFFFDRNAPSGERVTWSFLDIIMGSKNLDPGYENGPAWFLNSGSFRTHVAINEQVAKNNKGQIKPLRFSPTEMKGVSDHWPVVIELVPRN